MKFSAKLITALIIGALFFPGISEAKKKHKGPPSWAPAHGQRAKHKYQYYPSAGAYFDVDRKLFFFRDKGDWVSAPKLPPVIVPTPGHFVEIELDTDRPFIHFEEHRVKFPGGEATVPVPVVKGTIPVPLPPLPGVKIGR